MAAKAFGSGDRTGGVLVAWVPSPPNGAGTAPVAAATPPMAASEMAAAVLTATSLRTTDVRDGTAARDSGTTARRDPRKASTAALSPASSPGGAGAARPPSASARNVSRDPMIRGHILAAAAVISASSASSAERARRSRNNLGWTFR
ncbi:hypothetical protein BCD49_01205 [Pseudofrankia sp. EUN1h]|nr:hypothetical protein BCD49_01205 [Pseudofrankia sp. EUN1h]